MKSGEASKSEMGVPQRPACEDGRLSSRRAWKKPMLQRLAASEAELATGPRADAEGFS